MTRVAVVVFPGSNCDRDSQHAFESIDGVDVEMVWHEERDLGAVDLVVLPGGFSFGDHLRSGAIASCSPVMDAVRDAVDRDVLVLGICNGFQVLCETGLLPGALVRNEGMHFTCRHVPVEVVRSDTAFTAGCDAGDVLSLPIAHGEGCYVAAPEDLARLEERGQVVLRYADGNPNGSVNAIAGIVNERGNVFGLMPHPERAMDERLGSSDGVPLLTAITEAARAHALT